MFNVVLIAALLVSYGYGQGILRCPGECEYQPCGCCEEGMGLCKECHANGCDQCDDSAASVFKRGYSYYCEYCSDIFGDACNFCQDTTGCGQCKDFYDQANNIRYERTLDSTSGLYYCKPQNVDVYVASCGTTIPNSYPDHDPDPSCEAVPTFEPTERPSSSITDRPTESPSYRPTKSPTNRPTNSPTERPTNSPSDRPSQSPTDRPSDSPTDRPSRSPTDRPTMSPSIRPTRSPTDRPTNSPSDRPSKSPTDRPTMSPTDRPSQSPSDRPSESPSDRPTKSPSDRPTKSPVSECPNECEHNPCKCDEPDLNCMAGTCHANGCDQCKNGYFKLDYNYKCVGCQDTFGKKCLHCTDFIGCQQCEAPTTRAYDADCGLYYCEYSEEK